MFNKKIILASQSPRRADLLRLANIDFEQQPTDIEEIVNPNLSPEEVTKDIALQKLNAIQRTDKIVLASDTIVVLNNEILGKPTNLEDAKQMLKKLSGNMHQVISGVAIGFGEKTLTFAETTKVFFKELSDEDIEFYVSNFKPLDKAGSYAIQEYIGAVGIEKIEGDYYNVMGLPISRVVKELRAID